MVLVSKGMSKDKFVQEDLYWRLLLITGQAQALPTDRLSGNNKNHLRISNEHNFSTNSSISPISKLTCAMLHDQSDKAFDLAL